MKTDNTTFELKKNTSASSWKASAAGLGTGIILGSVSSLAAANRISPSGETEEVIPETDNNEEVEATPSYADESISIAEGVNDEMSFSEAFAAARAEVGPGGAFEWRGNVYGTYTADEWNNMTADDRQEYFSHFNWSNAGSSSNNDAEANNDAGASLDDDIEVHTVEEPGSAAVDNQEVEVLGVAYDSDNNANIAAMVVDGHDAIMVDVDNDGVFDVMAVDVNEDGQLSDNEIVNIAEANLTVSEVNSMAMGDIYATNDGLPDYVNDANVDYDSMA